jgi:hypothetical protein
VSGLLRIQLSRAKGWRMPAHTLKVDRSTRYGNPWRIVAPGEHRRHWWVCGTRTNDEFATRAEATALSLRKFRYHAETHRERYAGLAGMNLGCWCRLCPRHKAGKPLGEPCADCDLCHADVIGELVNGGAA